MKKITLSVVFLMIFCGLVAIPQDLLTAQKIANNFLFYKSENAKIIDFISLEKLHIFQLEPSGFVVVSNDNDIHPIIAYSMKANLENFDQPKNNLIQMLTKDIELRLAHLSSAQKNKNQLAWQNLVESKFNANRTFQQWPAENSTPTDGWVETNWNQGGIYNDFCPIDNSDERSNVGCVATAMAQIVNFHKFIGNPVLTFNNYDDYYAGGGIDIDNDYQSRDFPSFSELNGYLLDLWNHYEFEMELTVDNMAALSFACGVAVEMQYSSNGSSASTSAVGYNLRNKFDFDNGYYYNMSGSFYDNLQENMKLMRPAQLSVYNAEGGGHSIICDGYNTDGYFHLNMGWGDSNQTCWYLLPSEIPSNYSIVSGGVLNIEGGEIPVSVDGNVSIVGGSTPGTYITLDGEYFYEVYVDLYSGDFEIPAVKEGTYIATAIQDGRVFYDSFEIYIDENNDFIQFDLGNYEAVTGVVTAPINPVNSHIALYQNGEFINSAVADENGFYSISDVLPGNYVAIANLEGNYFEEKNVVITLENQVIDFNLAEYAGNLTFSYANYVVDKWNFIANYTLTCAIKMTTEELVTLDGDIFSKIRFKSPINSSDGELFAQIWLGECLVSEKRIEDFIADEWLEVPLDFFVPINSSNVYYVGYKITSSTGEFAYHDAGPRIVGKGAFTRNTGWTELPSQNDYNFCIEAIAVTQEFGSISGVATLLDGDGNLEDVVIKTDNFITHPNSNELYSIDLKPNNYNLSASLLNYEPQMIENITLNNDEIIEDQNFSLPSNSGESDDDVINVDRIIIIIIPIRLVVKRIFRLY